MRRGTRVGQAYIAMAVDGDGVNEDIVKSVDEAGPGVEKAGKEHGKRYSDGFDEESKGRLNKMLDRITGAAKERFHKGGDDSGKEFSKGFEDHFGNDFLDRLGRRVGGHVVDGLNFAISREGGDNPIADLVDHWMSEVVSGNGRGSSSKSKAGKGLTGIDDWLLNSRSRNNAVNLLAKSIGGIIHGFDKLFSALGNLSVVQKFADKLGLLAGEGEQAGGMLSKLATSGIASAAGIAAVIIGASILVSVLGSLVALATALAATIAGALVGAALVGAGAMTALAAAGGLLVLAFTSMTDAQKKFLADAFKPLKAEMTGIGQIVLQEMIPAFSTWSANLQTALMQLVPVAQVAGTAFAQAGDTLTKSFSGPGFQMFTQALAVYLPGIVTHLASALGSFLNGLLAVFTVILPYVNQFAGYLAQVAQNFSAWATSAQGQNSISDFVSRAVVSLKSLWDAVSAIGGFITKVLFSPQAMDAGNSIFESIARTFQDFTHKIAVAQADGSFKKWFDDAIQFGGQLWAVVKALGGTFIALYNSGVIHGVTVFLAALAKTISWANDVIAPLVNALGVVFPYVIGVALIPFQALESAIIGVVDAGKVLFNLLGMIGSIHLTNPLDAFGNNPALGLGGTGGPGTPPQVVNPGTHFISKTPQPTMPDIQALGTSALNATSIKSGGYKPPKTYHNPYVAYANSLIKQGPSTKAALLNAMLTLNKAAASGIRAAAADKTGAASVRSSMASLIDSLKTGGAQAVNTAQSALNSAAESLASASSAKAAKSALRKVHQAQADVRTALADQARINKMAKTLSIQNIVRGWNVAQLLNGVIRSNTTLAEFAQARADVAARITAANQQLANAISLRDNYKTQIEDSIKSFASLANVQGQTVDGVVQAITSGDITSTLQDRLDKIKKFQADLKLLLAEGLSNDAYKQIVDQGVTDGTALADALIAGGTTAIQGTNSLVSQINGIATTLGTDTSNRLYQAGVDAAKGLVDGLTSLSAQLDSAATKLGNSIAAAVKKSLGIKSPSKVLRDMMGYVGDGAVLGLEDQHVKVGNAASALADLIAVNPGGGPPAAGGPVSGNAAPGVLWTGDIVTPTEDPHAVAREVLNELVGRLP